VLRLRLSPLPLLSERTAGCRPRLEALLSLGAFERLRSGLEEPLKFELNPRQGAVTCAFCLTEIGQESWTCEGCGVLLHEACVAEVSICPTVGCDRVPAAPPVEVEEPRPQRTGAARSRRRREPEDKNRQQAALMASAMLGMLPGGLLSFPLLGYIEEVAPQHWTQETQVGFVVLVVSVVTFALMVGVGVAMNRLTGYPRRPF
jgi:hypothetical protein